MAAATDAPAAPPKWKPTADEQADLDAMNAAITRMQKHTPKDPYVLEIPQDVEPRYHHPHPATRRQWLDKTPFVDGEHEITQYQTFHFYEHGKEMYVLHSSRREERASNLSTRPAANAMGSAAPKKKITLDAYKKKQNGVGSTPELKATKASDALAKQAAVKGPIERVKAETEEMLAAVAEDEVLTGKKGNGAAPPNDLKRKREGMGAVKKPDDNKGARGPVEVAEPAVKKAKLSGERAVEDRNGVNGSRLARAGHEKTGKSPVAPEENGLPPRMVSPEYPPAMPPRLSPGMEERPKPKKAEDLPLPKRLTPNMPDNISKSLQAREQSSAAPVVKSASKEKGRMSPIRKEASKITKHKSPVPRNGFRAGSNSPIKRPSAQDRGRPTSSMAQDKNAELSQDDEIAVGRARNSRKAVSPQSTTPSKYSLMVKMKYKKAHAMDIARMLKMRPAPKKIMLPSPPLTAKSVENGESTLKPAEKTNGERKEATATKGVAQRVGPAAARKKREAAALQAEKQAALDNSASVAKSVAMDKQASQDKRPVHEKPMSGEKRQLPDDEKRESPTKRKKLEGPEARKEATSPVPRDPDSPAGQHKSHLQATPTARNNLLAVHMARDKSQDSNSTPTPSAPSSTPHLTSQPTGQARPPSSAPVIKTPRQQAWETEQRRLETLGRDLKHASTAHLHPTPSSDPSTIPHTDQKLAAVKAVESFLCYLLAFTCADEAAIAAEPRQAPPGHLWRSLLGFYGFVRRNSESFPLLFGLASSLGVVFSSRIVEIATQLPTEPGATSKILEFSALLQRAASDAESKFDMDVLQEQFPRAWSQRARKPLPSRERLEPGKLGGSFRLPFGVATSPIRAARAGHLILQEWMEKEGVAYELKLKLKPE
ncbi:unnamed protein product [Zymoseptoria tritici ST99CH_1E4]|uniref:Uncharacterized protein n=1 Tax=Zymoseptoria tritici ST99CH_1E4 TaxID=1276532 RepID=A0A2H1FXA2_ZYMTR|nr:unnamed protein product [Zymoseptoria tritici ST99CH_1E4]